MKQNETTSIAVIDDSTLEEIKLAEKLYYSAGLDPVVDAGIRDHDKHIELENKFLNKVFGPRGTDIRGYGEAVAKRVAVAVYNELGRQYGGKVGDLREYIMALEEERDRANLRYDELMGRAIGILGEEYKDLRSDSKEFMEKLTNVMGEDLKVSRINSEAITEKLADIDGLRSQIRTLAKEKELLKDTSAKEKEQLKERYESQIADINNEHKVEIGNLKERHKSQTTESDNQHKAELRNLDSRINALAKEKELLADTSAKEKEHLKERYEQQIVAINNDHKVETRNLNEKYESQIAEANSEYKAELRKLNSRVEILAKEKELQKEKYESQIADLDLTIRGLQSKKAG